MFHFALVVFRNMHAQLGVDDNFFQKVENYSKSSKDTFYYLRMTCPAVTWVQDGEISDNADPAVDDHAQTAKENSSKAVPVTT